MPSRSRASNNNLCDAINTLTSGSRINFSAKVSLRSMSAHLERTPAGRNIFCFPMAAVWKENNTQSFEIGIETIFIDKWTPRWTDEHRARWRARPGLTRPRAYCQSWCSCCWRTTLEFLQGWLSSRTTICVVGGHYEWFINYQSVFHMNMIVFSREWK